MIYWGVLLVSIMGYHSCILFTALILFLKRYLTCKDNWNELPQVTMNAFSIPIKKFVREETFETF